MAQAFAQQPIQTSFSDNPLLFTFYEGGAVAGSNIFDNVNTKDFYFKVDVLIEGSLVFTERIYISKVHTTGGLIYGYAKYDASNIVRNYVSDQSISNALVSEASVIKYKIQFTPIYVSSGVLTTGSTTASSDSYAVKGKLTWTDFLKYEDNTLLDKTASAFDFFTQFPSTEKYYCGRNENVYLLAILPDIDGSKEFTRIDIKLKDVTGATIVTETITITSLKRGAFINASPDTIIASSTITSANFESCASWTIIIRNAGSTIKSKEFEFWMDEECSRYSPARTYFTAKAGSVEAFTWKALSRRMNQTTVQNFETLNSGWNGSAYEYSTTQGGKQSLITETERSLMIHSDFMSEDVQQWLVQNCYESTSVLLTYKDTTERVVLKARSYELKLHVNDLLVKEEATFLFSQRQSSAIN